MKIKEQEITIEEILDHWEQGKTSLDWRPLTIKGKGEWLRACLSWTGLPQQRISSFNYIIDGNQVTADLDFYCLLGETFFGYRGYFGQDSHGFNDCFTEILIHEESKVAVDKGAKVIIKSSGHLMEVLTEDILSEILKSFSGHGFVVDLD